MKSEGSIVEISVFIVLPDWLPFCVESEVDIDALVVGESASLSVDDGSSGETEPLQDVKAEIDVRVTVLPFAAIAVVIGLGATMVGTDVAGVITLTCFWIPWSFEAGVGSYTLYLLLVHNTKKHGDGTRSTFWLVRLGKATGWASRIKAPSLTRKNQFSPLSRS